MWLTDFEEIIIVEFLEFVQFTNNTCRLTCLGKKSTKGLYRVEKLFSLNIFFYIIFKVISVCCNLKRFFLRKKLSLMAFAIICQKYCGVNPCSFYYKCSSKLQSCFLLLLLYKKKKNLTLGENCGTNCMLVLCFFRFLMNFSFEIPYYCICS